MPALFNWLSAYVRTTAFRLVAIYVALFVIVAALITGALFWQTNALLTREVLAALNSEAAGLEAIDRSGGANALKDAVQQRSETARGSLYFLTDPEGRKLAGNLSRWPPELEVGGGGLFRYASGGSERDEQRLAVGISTLLPNGERLLVSRDVEQQMAFIARVRRLFLAGVGVLVVVGLGAGILASRYLLRRIEAITATSDSIMAGDLARRIPVMQSGDELDDLARSLNAMLERIEQLMVGMREVSDNIAHDLKTPLNRLRNRAEAALRDARGVADYREGLERTIEEADELIKTFNALLLIARLEAGAVEESFETFDLSVLVQDIADLYEPLAEEKGLALRLVGAGEVMAKGNRQLIGQAIANLIDNAIKYGQRGPAAPATSGPDAVEVSLRRIDSLVELTVADYGVGIPLSDRDRVLKRFVRLEASRTRPGTGLGLSLVAAVARLHRGEVRLEDNGPGLRVVLSWPVPTMV